MQLPLRPLFCFVGHTQLLHSRNLSKKLFSTAPYSRLHFRSVSHWSGDVAASPSMAFRKKKLPICARALSQGHRVMVTTCNSPVDEQVYEFWQHKQPCSYESRCVCFQHSKVLPSFFVVRSLSVLVPDSVPGSQSSIYSVFQQF